MIRVAFFGKKGSFSHVAAQKFFSGKAAYREGESVKNVFSRIAAGEADFGVVPVENSTTGSILETYDMLLKYRMHITGEVRLKIHHQLLVADKTIRLNDLRKCYSHPQAISQCEKFFTGHKNIKPFFTTDTAAAAKLISETHSRDCAAIAGLQTARKYNLFILQKKIEDNSRNFTRFVVIGKKPNETGDKASVAFGVKHVPGSLFKALAPYAGHHLNLTKIESRPILDKTWEYIFFVDFEINPDLVDFKHTIKDMKKETDSLTVLGIYRKGKTYET